MRKVLIKNKLSGLVTNQATFETQAEIDAWIGVCEANHNFGLPERPELNEMGEPTGVVLPAEYSIEVKDISAEIKAEKQAKEAKKLAKEKRKDGRKKLDWNKINTVAELKAIVKSLIEEIEALSEG